MTQHAKFNDGLLMEGDHIEDTNQVSYTVTKVDHSAECYEVEWGGDYALRGLRSYIMWDSVGWIASVGRRGIVIWDEHQGYCNITFGPSERPF